MLEIIKSIKEKYIDENGFPLYPNLDFFIEKNMCFIEEKIFPLLQETTYDLCKLSKFKLEKLIEEEKDHIEYHKRYLKLPDIDYKSWKAWQNMQLEILDEYNKKIQMFSLDNDIKDFIELRLSLINTRIDSFNKEMSENPECEAEKSIIIENIIKYKKFFIKYEVQIFTLCRLWECYYEYNIDERLETSKTKVIELYNKYSIDILKDKQFIKYGLIESTNYISNPPQLYDDRIHAVILLKNSSNEIIDLFLRIKDYIKNISFQINPESVFTGVKVIQYSLEHLQIGKYFDIQKFKNIAINKLYDENYQNFLWVQSSENNLTFEEIIDDFIVNGEDIASQVIHMQYYIEEGNLYITHIDHEYILYSPEQYELRKTDSHTKGKEKIKTFKIDNSKIPLVINDENILLQIIAIYFKKTELIEEYFQKKIREA